MDVLVWLSIVRVSTRGILIALCRNYVSGIVMLTFSTSRFQMAMMAVDNIFFEIFNRQGLQYLKRSWHV